MILDIQRRHIAKQPIAKHNAVKGKGRYEYVVLDLLSGKEYGAFKFQVTARVNRLAGLVNVASVASPRKYYCFKA